jgi:hypothetical protein
MLDDSWGSIAASASERGADPSAESGPGAWPDRTCPRGDHRAPRTGGSCACGMVTRIPARRSAPAVDVRDLLASSLGDVPDDPRQAADRLLAALAAAGLTVAARLPA